MAKAIRYHSFNADPGLWGSSGSMISNVLGFSSDDIWAYATLGMHNTFPSTRMNIWNIHYSNITHRGRETHKCVSKQNHCWSKERIVTCSAQGHYLTHCLFVVNLFVGRNIIEMCIKIQQFSYKKMNLKTSFANWRSFCLGQCVKGMWEVTRICENLCRVRFISTSMKINENIVWCVKQGINRIGANTETEMFSFWWNLTTDALEVVKVTTSSAASDENFVKLTTFSFQWMAQPWLTNYIFSDVFKMGNIVYE